MAFLSVIIAALAGWMFGAAWYMSLSKPWIEASGIKTGEDGKPEGNSPMPYILSAIAMVAQ